MKNFERIVLLSSCLSVGCASSGAHQAGGFSAERGVMVVPGGSVNGIVLGPKVVHTFSTGGGGNLYTASAVTGSDADCQEGAIRRDVGHPVSILANQPAILVVGVGEIACLATSGSNEFELLWHARSDGRSDAPTGAVLAESVRQPAVVAR